MCTDRARALDCVFADGRSLFSNSVAPAVVSASLAALDLLEERPELLAALQRNTADFRTQMTGHGFEVREPAGSGSCLWRRSGLHFCVSSSFS